MIEPDIIYVTELQFVIKRWQMAVIVISTMFVFVAKQNMLSYAE